MFGGVEFVRPAEPQIAGDPRTLEVKPENHPVANNGVDVVIGAEGSSCSLPGFRCCVDQHYHCQLVCNL